MGTAAWSGWMFGANMLLRPRDDFDDRRRIERVVRSRTFCFFFVGFELGFGEEDGQRGERCSVAQRSGLSLGELDRHAIGSNENGGMAQNSRERYEAVTIRVCGSKR